MGTGNKKHLLRLCIFTALILSVLLLGGCGKKAKTDEWLRSAGLDKTESSEELYEKALGEDILVVYTVTTRMTEVKEYFEKEYPGLQVEIRDLRSPNLVSAVEENYSKGDKERVAVDRLHFV